jgi:ribosome-associated protein
MNIEKLIKELEYKFTRSSGAGGQHVNKVSTKVVLRFDMFQSIALSEEEKEILSSKLENKISKDGILSLTSDATRSQLKNKKQVTKRFIELVRLALTPSKKRKPTKRPKSANLKRLQKKKNRAETKANRQKPKID